MIIAKTPLRVSYVGGGSDISTFYKEHGGAVLSSTINAYIYIIVKRKFDKGIRLSYSKTENVIKTSEIEHPLVRNALEMMNIKDDLEIVSIAEIPSYGTGLGSSSSFSVGLLNALSTFKKLLYGKEDLARMACKLEIDLCKNPIGKQDQYAASYGGLNLYRFHDDDSVSVENVKIKKSIKNKINREILFFYVGGARDANLILTDQKKMLRNNDKIIAMKKMVKLVDNLKNELEGNDLSNFGNILHENWILKKEMSSQIANSYIDNLYSEARLAGATGGKLLGAGGGGFMIFHAPTSEIRSSIRSKFIDLKEVDFNIEDTGTKILVLNRE